MPNIKSAKKRIKLSRAANVRNRARRSSIRTAIKRVRSAETAEEAEKQLRHAISLLDRASRTHLIHANRVARLKGQLTRHVSSLSA